IRGDANRPHHGGRKPPAHHVPRYRDPVVQGDFAMSVRNQLTVGTEFPLAPRLMTRERMRWYVDIQETVQADTGRIVTQPPTIHDDEAYAKKQGLPGIISDGMISTNWILGLLGDAFGEDAARKGRFRTKYIAPIYEDHVVITCPKVAP